MDQYQQLFDVLTRARNVSDQQRQRQSKAASMTLSMKEWQQQRQDAQCAKNPTSSKLIVELIVRKQKEIQIMVGLI